MITRDPYHIVPCSHDGFHVEVAGEESDNPIRYDLAVLHKDCPEVPHDSGIVANLEARAYSYLVTTPRDDLCLISFLIFQPRGCLPKVRMHCGSASWRRSLELEA